MTGPDNPVETSEYARTHSTQCLRSHQQIGSNVRQGSPLDNFRLVLHQQVVTLACSFEPPGVGFLFVK